MLTDRRCTGNARIKAVWISKTPAVVVIFILMLLFVKESMGEMNYTFKGYSKAEHKFASGQRVGIRKTAMIQIRWMLKKEQAHVTHVRFCDLSITNLKTGTPVAQKKVDSPDIPLQRLSPLEANEGRLKGGVWKIDRNEGPVNQMQEFVDYRVSGIAVELSNGKETNRKKFDILLMRDYKTVPASTVKGVDNWTVGPFALMSAEGSPVVTLRDTTYDPQLKRILTIHNYGYLSIPNGEIVFDEIVDRREVYYLKRINEEYKWVNGSLERFWEYEKMLVDPRPHGYKTIYQRGENRPD